MKVSRRTFLKLSGAATTTAALASLGLKKAGAAGYEPIRVQFAREITTICTFCSVGCSIICHVQGDKLINTEGDPDSPINEGALCSKGSALFNIAGVYYAKGKLQYNNQRLRKVLYRAPYSSNWEEKSWDWALETIAQRIKETRDATFERQNAQGVTVNRTTAISHLGSAFCTNEENYLFHKFVRALGLVNIDHCARL